MKGDKRKERSGGGRDARDGGDKAKRRRYCAEAAGSGRPWAKGSGGSEIRGPGIWITCPRKKEASSVTEAYDIFNEAADQIYPAETAEASTSKTKLDDIEGGTIDPEGDDHDEEDDIEAQIAKELQEIQPKTSHEKKQMRFVNVKTNCECLVWISCRPPCDPVVLVQAIAKNLLDGGAVRSKYLQRLTPVSQTAHADAASLRTMAYKVLQPIFAPEGYTEDEREEDMPIKYRTEPFLRNHTGSLSRDIVQSIIGDVVRDLTDASFQYPVPADTPRLGKETESQGEGTEDSEISTQNQSLESPPVDISPDSTGDNHEGNHDSKPGAAIAPAIPLLPVVRRRAYVDLKNPTHTILVSALKGVCGMSIVKGWEQAKRFNIQSLSERKVPDDAKADDVQVDA